MTPVLVMSWFCWYMLAYLLGRVVGWNLYLFCGLLCVCIWRRVTMFRRMKPFVYSSNLND